MSDLSRTDDSGCARPPEMVKVWDPFVRLFQTFLRRKILPPSCYRGEKSCDASMRSVASPLYLRKTKPEVSHDNFRTL
jgi:hypothetical protein